MSEELNRMYEESRLLIEDGHFDEAAELLRHIVSINPDYEHGQAFHELAYCFEELGELHEAEVCYDEALSREPLNPYYLGGYASFLYQFGTPERALEVYCELYNVEYDGEVTSESEKTMLGIREIADRLNLTDSDISHRIELARKRLEEKIARRRLSEDIQLSHHRQPELKMFGFDD